MRTTFETIIVLLLIYVSILSFIMKNEIEQTGMSAKTQEAILQDTKTISGNWKKIALDATDLTTTQQKRLDIQEESLNKAMQLIRLQEDNIKRLTK